MTSVTRGLPLLLVCVQAYEKYCKTWHQLIELKILFLSQTTFLFKRNNFETEVGTGPKPHESECEEFIVCLRRISAEPQLGFKIVEVLRK